MAAFQPLMAVVTAKSGVTTNRDASPVVFSRRFLMGADSKHARGLFSVASGDSIDSKYLIAEIPSNALVISVRVSSPDIGTTTAADIGLYKSTKDGGAVVDADFFKAAVVLNAGAIVKSEVVNGNVITLSNAEKAIFECLGLTIDPGLTYDVVVTLTGAADAAGVGLIEIDYAV